MAIRVLQVVTHMNRGGLETMIMNYYRHIDRDNVQFDFLTHRTNRCDYDEEIEKLGGVIYHLPQLNPWSLTYRKELNKFFTEHPEYKIVHVHQDCMSSVILKAAKNAGVPVRIAHSHNSSQDKNAKYIIKLFYKVFIPKYATYLFSCGKEAGEWMFNGKSFAILNNAIDAKKYSFDPIKRIKARKELSIDDDTILMGHVGRFSEVKNHSFLIDIIKYLSIRKNSKLLLVGDGELRNKIEDKVKALKLESKVIFTGLRDDVDVLMQAMDVFVMPSLYEGLPLVLVEAQAAGLPCVVSNGIPSECKLTDLVNQLSLNETVDKWAENIISVVKRKRKDMFSEINDKKFDIENNSQWLQAFYLDKDSKIRKK